VEPLDLLRLWAGLCALSLRQLGLCADRVWCDWASRACEFTGTTMGCGVCCVCLVDRFDQASRPSWVLQGAQGCIGQIPRAKPA
jgi:hypothetical protein